MTFTVSALSGSQERITFNQECRFSDAMREKAGERRLLLVSFWKFLMFAGSIASVSCLPRRTEKPATLYTLSKEQNARARTREAVCADEGGVWEKDYCRKGTPSLSGRESCSMAPGWLWHEKSGKCLPDATVKNQERCESNGMVYNSVVGDCTYPGSQVTDCLKVEKGLTWDGLECVPESEPKNFYRWCIQKNNSADITHTIEQLKQLFNLAGCHETYTVLFRKRILYLQNKNLKNIEPLWGLKNLESLVLGKNKISDLSPLESLTSLTYLDLYGNNVSDISPVQNIIRLETIYLNGNPVESIISLKNHVNIKEIQLEDTPLDLSTRDETVCPHDAKSDLIADYCQGK